MISLDEAVTARLESHGQRFEVLVDPDAALAIKRDDFDDDLEDVIAAEDVFEDASRGDRPPENMLEEVFDTTEPMAIIPKSSSGGRFRSRPTSAARCRNKSTNSSSSGLRATRSIRRWMTRHTRRSALSPPSKKRISELTRWSQSRRRSTMPRCAPAGHPHPVRRGHRRRASPRGLRRERPGPDPAVRRLEREEWQSDGSWVGVMTFPAGLQNDFYDVVNEHTSGEAETQIIKDEDDISTR